MNPVTILRSILPAPILAFLDRLAGLVQRLLQGEPLRLVTVGGAVVVTLVTHIADIVWPGHIRVVDVDTAIVVATTAAGVVAEVARRWVYSPATVARLKNEHEQELEDVARAAFQAGATTPNGPAATGEGPVDETAKGAVLADNDEPEAEPAEDLEA